MGTIYQAPTSDVVCLFERDGNGTGCRCARCTAKRRASTGSRIAGAVYVAAAVNGWTAAQIMDRE